MACQLLDIPSCRCGDYANRFTRVPACTRLTQQNLAEFDWLPYSCAYRHLAQGKGLADWHPLLSGDRTELHRRGISRDIAVCETQVRKEDWPEHIIAML